MNWLLQLLSTHYSVVFVKSLVDKEIFDSVNLICKLVGC